MKVGDIVKGRITNIKPYGAFVRIDDETNGLIHISEISDQYVSNIEDIFKVGDVVELQVIKITDDNKISLSHRSVARKKRQKHQEVTLTEGFKPFEKKLPEWIDNYSKKKDE
ncbi:MAG: S1 RNA-binding domain-containing protein [Acholeplasmataceae bacterium]|nr:S1 RNA-binding domain-containing protein [Acholeplasmataceae bacterium]